MRSYSNGVNSRENKFLHCWLVSGGGGALPESDDDVILSV